MPDSYEVMSAIVIDERKAFAGIEMIERRLQVLEARIKRTGYDISRWLGKGFRDAARGSEHRWMHRSLDGISRHAKRTGKDLERALGGGLAAGMRRGGGGAALGLGGLGLGGILAGGAGVAGAGFAARGILGLHTQLENAVGGIATSYNVFQGQEIDSAKVRAERSVNLLNDAAATGVGRLDDYVGGFQKLLALNTGLGDDALVQLTKQSLTAGAASGRGAEGLRLAPMDIVQAIEGGLQEGVTQIASNVVRTTGMTSEAFNKLGQGDRIKVLQEGFAKYNEGAALIGKTWDARLETVLDKVRLLGRRLTKPLFETWSDQLDRANSWLEANEDRLNNIVDKWGPRLAAMWDHLIEKAGLYAAIVAGAAVGQQVGGIAASGRGGGGGGGVLSQLAGGAGKAGGLATAAGGTVTLAAAVALLAGTAAAAYGAIESYPSLLTDVTEVGYQLWDGLTLLGATLAALAGEGAPLRLVSDLIGGAFMRNLWGLGAVLNIVVRGVGFIIEAFNLFFGTIFHAAKTLGPTFRMIGAFLSGDRAAGVAAAKDFRRMQAEHGESVTGSQERLRRLLGMADESDKALKKGAAETPGGGTGGTGGSTTKPPVTSGNVNIGKVEVVVQRDVNSDPARVAMAFSEVLGKVNRNRRQARRLPKPVMG